MDEHLKSTLHAEAVKANRLQSLTVKQLVDNKATIDSSISKIHEALFKKIGSQMITVFNDAKRGNLSAWSWPSRETTHQKGLYFIKHGSQGSDVAFDPKVGDLQYLTPSHHSQPLDCIVQSNHKSLHDQLSVNALAISLRTDGSVDRTQIHNNNVMAKVIHKDGRDSLIFLGFAERKERGAQGYLAGMKRAIDPVTKWEKLFKKCTSIVTDGKNMNTGAHNELWALCQKERDASGTNLPLLKI